MKIKPTASDVRTLLESNFYRIPRFQRPYSWEKENVEDFWRDTVVTETPEYFIGSMVVYRKNEFDDTFWVVDGQQRLTTVTLLLAAIRNELQAQGFEPLAKGTQKLIEKTDLNNDSRYVVQSETPYPYLQEHIQKFGPPELDGKSGEEEDNLKQSFDLLTDKLRELFEPLEAANGKTLKEVIRDRVLEVRDRVLKLRLIMIELDNEDDAYLIFETLNTRGKDLRVADLVKNHLARQLKPKSANVDVARDKWMSILDLFDASKEDIDINRFLHHTWLSRHEYIPENALFKEAKAAVQTAKQAQEYLDQLVREAAIYRDIIEPDWRSWKKEERAIMEPLQALKLFRVQQSIPLVISVLRDHRADKLSTKQARAFMETLESFHFLFTAVTAQRAGGGMAMMYAQAGRELLQRADANAKAKHLQEFTKKLRDRIPSYPEFEANFVKIRYLYSYTKQRALAKYILARLDAHARQADAMAYDKMTIEHLAPQKPVAGQGPSAALVGQLGNMILIPEKLNGKLGNKGFAEKLKALKQAGVPLEAEIEQATAWGSAEIAARTKRLSSIAYAKVWKI